MDIKKSKKYFCFIKTSGWNHLFRDNHYQDSSKNYLQDIQIPVVPKAGIRNRFEFYS